MLSCSEFSKSERAVIVTSQWLLPPTSKDQYYSFYFIKKIAQKMNIAAEHYLKLCWVAQHFRFLKKQDTLQGIEREQIIISFKFWTVFCFIFVCNNVTWFWVLCKKYLNNPVFIPGYFIFTIFTFIFVCTYIYTYVTILLHDIIRHLILMIFVFISVSVKFTVFLLSHGRAMILIIPNTNFPNRIKN